MATFKPLLTINGETITDLVISTYRQNGIAVYLVTGYESDKLLSSIKNHDIQIVENSDYRSGMFGSIQAGISHLPADTDFFFVAPVDVPLVRSFTIRRMIEKAEADPGKIIYPEFKGTRGHPALIPMLVAPAILAWEMKGGLKGALDSREDLALEVAVPDRYTLMDIDSPEDYTMLLDGFSHYQVPTTEECGVILNEVARVSPEVLRHCLKVADVAENIGQAITASFVNLDQEAIRSGALLHDILKGQPDHAAAGGRWLSEMGFSGITEIVSAHTDLPAGMRDTSLEAKVVYLADKYVSGDSIVPLEERFQFSMRNFGSDAAVKTEILKRQKQALAVKNEIEKLLRRLLDGIVFS